MTTPVRSHMAPRAHSRRRRGQWQGVTTPVCSHMVADGRDRLYSAVVGCCTDEGSGFQPDRRLRLIRDSFRGLRRTSRRGLRLSGPKTSARSRCARSARGHAPAGTSSFRSQDFRLALAAFGPHAATLVGSGQFQHVTRCPGALRAWTDAGPDRRLTSARGGSTRCGAPVPARALKASPRCARAGPGLAPRSRCARAARGHARCGTRYRYAEPVARTGKVR